MSPEEGRHGRGSEHGASRPRHLLGDIAKLPFKKSLWKDATRQQEWIPQCLGVLGLSYFLHMEGFLIAVVWGPSRGESVLSGWLEEPQWAVTMVHRPGRASFRVISASPVLVFSLWPHCASDLYLTSGDLDAGDAVNRGGRAPCWWLLLCCPGPYCSTTVMPARGPAVCSSPFARTFGRCQDANLLACHLWHCLCFLNPQRRRFRNSRF